MQVDLSAGLTVRREVVEVGYQLAIDVVRLDNLCKFAQVGGSSSPHHGRVITAQITEPGAQL